MGLSDEKSDLKIFQEHPRNLSCVFLICLCLAVVSSASPVSATIGGQTAEEGDFTLEDVEDRDLRADPLGRDWVPDFVRDEYILSPLDLSQSGLTPAPEQSPLGALKASIPSDGFGTISGGFGVPMPGEVGASTLVSPGDIASFENLAFLACFEPSGLPNLTFKILLECYPENLDGTFPTVVWTYSPATGKDFQPVEIDLAHPDSIENNPNGFAVEDLLSQTRFLYFYFFANPVSFLATLEFHIDDIQIQPPLSTETVTPTSTVTASATPNPPPTATPTDEPVASPTRSLTPTAAPSFHPTRTNTPTLALSATGTPIPSSTSTSRPTETPASSQQAQSPTSTATPPLDYDLVPDHRIDSLDILERIRAHDRISLDFLGFAAFWKSDWSNR